MPRRAPDRDQRQRDAERTREAILDSALIEFGDHGYAGARTAAIAQRAGVNQQLISYYFDGKAGLYQALNQRWSTVGAPLAGDDRTLVEVVTGFVRLSQQARSWSRLLIWEALAPASGESYPSATAAAELLSTIRRRQEAGEIAAELDPAVVLVVLFSAALAPVTLGGLIESVVEGGEQAYAERLVAVVRQLGPESQRRDSVAGSGTPSK